MSPSSPDQTQSPVQLLYPDFESELASTRRVLERYPEGKMDWKPHEKSMALGALATHVAELPGLGAMLLEMDESDIAARKRTPPAENATDLLKIFDATAEKLHGALAKATLENLDKAWTLRNGDQVLLSGKRRNFMRGLLMNHIIHHRAQLGVYYRLLGIPVPAIYGPSADEAPSF
jgi:uncharacterized damage-inducible protein DinB